MSEKEFDSTEVAKKLLEKETKANNEKVMILFPRPEYRSVLHARFFGVDNVVTTSSRAPVYPVNKADQLHGQSIAELIRQGQGEISEVEKANFDFVDGQKDDGREVLGLKDLDFADVAERYEREREIHTDIVTGLRREASEQVEKLSQQRKAKEETKNSESV